MSQKFQTEQQELDERIEKLETDLATEKETGENLPDVAVLPDLAKVLETTVDFILNGGEKAVEYKGRINVSDMIDGIKRLEESGRLLGKENIIYRSAINGINETMNTDIEEAFANNYAFEAFVAETVIQNLIMGAYVDVKNVKNSFRHEHFRKIVLDYCARYSLK